MNKSTSHPAIQLCAIPIHVNISRPTAIIFASKDHSANSGDHVTKVDFPVGESPPAFIGCI